MQKINEIFPQIKTGISLNGEMDEKTIRYILSIRPIIKSVVNRERFIPEKALHFIEKGIPYYLILRDILSGDELRHSMPFYEFIRTFNEIKRGFKNVMPVYCDGFISDKDYRCPAGTEKLSIIACSYPKRPLNIIQSGHSELFNLAGQYYQTRPPILTKQGQAFL